MYKRQDEGDNNGKKFEKGHEELGKVLGYISKNINTDGSPDPYWIIADMCFVSEDKIYKSEKEIPINDAREVATHKKWIQQNEPLVTKNTRIYTVFISNSERLDSDAKHIVEDIYYLNYAIFLDWAKRALDTIRTDVYKRQGYDADENGKLVVNKQQAKIVKRIFIEFLWGKTPDYIKRIFEREGVINWDGGTKWQSTTIGSMLENEKYKGDTLLQKSYTVDFLTKKRVQNEGEVQQYYIEDDHEAIIEPWIWECVQLEMKRRERYLEEHNITRFSQNTGTNPFSSKIICGECNRAFARKGWRTPNGDRKVWQCSERYKVKGCLLYTS